MPDEIELAQEREMQDRERALQADARRRAAEQPAPAGAIGLCIECRDVLVEEARIKHGFTTCAACARELERIRTSDRRAYPRGSRA